MINKYFEAFLNQEAENFLIPAEKLAVLIDSHNMDHAKLLLSHMTYSRVPVVTQEGLFVGTIGLTEICKHQLDNDLSEAELSQDISCLVKKDIPYLREDFKLDQLMGGLTEASFLPVVNDEGYFRGIITRKSVLRAVNQLLHNFASVYTIGEKDDSH